MKSFHIRWLTHPLFQFTCSYIVMMLIALIMAANTVWSIRRANEQHAVQVNQLVLQHTVENIDNSLNTIDLFTNMLFTDSSLCAFLNRANQRDITADEIIPIIKALPSLSDSNEIISNYFVYSPRQGFIVTSRQGYLNTSQYYRQNYFSYGNYSFDEWSSLLLKGCSDSLVLPSVSNVYNGKQRESIVLITPYINPNTGQSLGCIVFYLDSTCISKLLSAAQDTQTCFNVRDGMGRLLLSSDPEMEASLYSPSSDISGTYLKKIGSKSMQVTYLKSLACKWTFTLAIGRRGIILKSWNDSLSVVLTAIILLVLGLCIAAYLFFQNRRPLSRIVSQLHSNMSATNPSYFKNNLWQLNNAVSNLSKNHQELKKVYDEQQFQLKNIFINRLTSGDISDEENIEKALTQLNIDIKGTCFYGIYMQIFSESLKDNAIIQSQIILEMKQYTELTLLAQVDDNTYQLIMTMNEYSNCLQNINYIFSSFHRWLKVVYNLESRFCVGYLCTKLGMLHHSFRAAKSLLGNEYDGRYILIGEHEAQIQDNYLYTYQHKQTLIKYLNNGLLEDTSNLLHSIYEWNFTQKQLSEFSRKLLYSAIVNTLINSSYHVSVNEEFRYTFLEFQPLYFFDSIAKICGDICYQQQQRYQQERNELTQSILKYIQDNIGNYDMSLAHLSMKFGMTEKYISFYIKENAGVNFLTYLEQLRIEKANQLLMTSMPIADIAVKVGYINVNSFRRCYHRHQGISPSEYRKQIRLN